MNRILRLLEKYFLPLANTLGQIRWLVALRNSFISLLPITIVGSLAVAIQSLVSAAQTQLGWTTFALMMHPLVLVSRIVWRGTLMLFALYLAQSLGYHLAKVFETNRLAGSIVSVASFTMSVANFAELTNGQQHFVLQRAFDISQFDSSGVFTAIVFGSIGFSFYLLFYRARMVIRLRATLPHAEIAAFEALIPAMAAIFLVGGINLIFQTMTKTYFGSWLLDTIQMPLLHMGQGFGMVLLVTALVSVFSFFGLSGPGALAPLLDSIWLTAQNVNVAAVVNHRQPGYLWTRSSFDVFAWCGGAGGTLVLIMVILIIAKKSDLQAMAKVALGPSFLNIGEPIVFGLPIVLNPIYLIPFVLAPVVNVALSYWVTWLHLVNPVQVSVPSIMPPILGAYFATNYDWRAIILCLVNLVVAALIWMPFVKMADGIGRRESHRVFFSTQY